MLDNVPARREQPSALKFAYPMVLIPELFTTISHLALMIGYLVSLGWEVYAIDPYAPAASGASRTALLDSVRAAIVSINRKVVVAGHGLGGLLALGMADHSAVAAAIALAPALPGFASPLYGGLRKSLAIRLGRQLRPPTGRLLFEFIADADPFHRETLIRDLRGAPSRPVLEVVGGSLTPPPAAAAPRLILAGDSDLFAPRDRVERFARAINAQCEILVGRGHWLIGGRAMERAIADAQRFLVQHLSEELLLLYQANADHESDHE